MDNEGIPLPEKESSRFFKARPGDMLMVPFQCDICHFRNMLGRKPEDTNILDIGIHSSCQLRCHVGTREHYSETKSQSAFSS